MTENTPPAASTARQPAALATLLSVMAVASAACSTRIIHNSDGYYIETNGTVRVGTEINGTTYSAVLVRETGATTPQVLRVDELNPAADGAPRGLAWLFRHFDPSVALRVGGVLHPHPDNAAQAALLDRLATSPPDLGGALSGLQTLLRMASRRRVFVAACAVASGDSVDFMIEAAQRGMLGTLWLPALDGREPAGNQSENYAACLQALAAHPELTTQRADRVAALIDGLNSSKREAVLVTVLIPSASPQALVNAATKISSSKSRYKALAALAARTDLTTAHADALAAATPGLNSSKYEARVLNALVSHASVDALVKAAGEIRGVQQRCEVFGELAKRSDLSQDEANVVAAAVPSLNSSDYEAATLGALLQHASIGTLLTAALEIKSSRARFDVLYALAKRPDITRSDADLLVTGVARQARSSHTANLLLLLAEKASKPVLLDAVGHISSGTQRERVLEAIARRN